ncbi:MAG: tetratricopeptide repeat protein, partial [Planctomycetales bacterium]|nr:tetratricopeptide repeat protein [Planctomycetales bacterium]
MEVSSLNPDLMFMRASINLDSGDLAAAKETLSRLKHTGAKPVQIGLLQARIQLAENNFVSASQTLERLNPAQNSQVRELLYRCYVRLGKTDKARELTAAAEASLNGSSSDASVLINRARLAHDSGDLQTALRNYQEIWEKHQNMLTPEGKETIFKQMLDIRIELELAKNEQARDWSGVDAMVASWKTNPKLSRDDVELFEISIMNRKGNVREAMERVEQAKMRSPNYLAYWMLHNTMITDHEQAMKVLNLMQQRFGDIAIVRRLKLDRFARIGTENALAQAEQLLDGMDQFEKEDQQTIKRMAAEFNMRLKKFDRAIEIWQELKQANPTSLTLHAELLDLAIQAGNEPLITDTVSAIGELAGKDSTDWQLGEAQRIIWQVQNERRDASAIPEIKRLLSDVQRLRPDYPLLYKSLADLAILENDPQAAYNALQTGLQKSTGNTRYVFLKQLGSLLTQMGRVQEGQHFLQQLPEEMRGRQDELTALVILAQRDPKAALQKAQESISQDTTDPRELSMLADLYFVNEQYDQTAALLKRATELDPKSPQPWQRRATMLVQMDRKDEVDALLPTIQTNLEDPKKSLVLGQINAVLKRPDEAERWYQQALDGGPNDVTLLRNMAQFYLHREFNRTEKAWPILDRMEKLDPSNSLNAANSQWARQQSALLLAQSGTFEDFQKAIQKLEENANGGKLTGVDLQLWLQICAERPDASSRKMAADKLDEIALSRDLSTNEMKMRANLASQSGDWQQTRQMFMDLISRNAKNEELKASYCAQLIQHDNLSEAKRWLAQLTDGSSEKVQLQALIYAKENKAADAQKLLVSFAQHIRKDTPAALATVALAAETAAKNDAAATNGKMSPLWGLAEQLWQAFDKDNAESELELARFYARVPQGKRLTQALKLSRSELQNALKENDEAACMDYITVGIIGLHNSREALGSDSKLYDEVEKWINACRA